jgi:hypothetical protein
MSVISFETECSGKTTYDYEGFRLQFACLQGIRLKNPLTVQPQIQAEVKLKAVAGIYPIHFDVILVDVCPNPRKSQSVSCRQNMFCFFFHGDNRLNALRLS